MSRNRQKKHNHYEINTKLKSNIAEMCGRKQKKEKYLQIQKKNENIEKKENRVKKTKKSSNIMKET